MISDEKFVASRELMEQAYSYLRDGYEQALNALEEAETENVKLRKELADTPKCETCEAMLDCDECLRADGSHKERRRLSAENAKMRDELDAAKHDLSLFSERIVELGAENAKLRELAHLVAEYTSADQCEGCVTKRACNAGELDMCWIRNAILEKLRELGSGGGRVTNYEAFFGTPKRAAKTMGEVVLDGQDFCFMMDALSTDKDVKCRNCINEFDHYGCERKPVTYLEWLMQEVTE